MQSFQRQVARTTSRSLPLANRNAGSTISRRCISQQTGQGARDRAAVGVSQNTNNSRKNPRKSSLADGILHVAACSLSHGEQEHCSR